MLQNRLIRISVLSTRGEVTIPAHSNDAADLSPVAVAADTLYFSGGKYTFRGGDTDSRGICWDR